MASQVIGNTSDDDDIGAMLNLFCAALAEKSAGIFVMTLTDMDIAESCSRLMEAIQQLSQTIKQLESFHVKQQQQKLKTIVTSPMGGPPPLPSLPASTQSLPVQAPTEVPVSPSVPVAETAVASASTAPPPPVSKSPPPAPQFDGKIQPAIIEETTVDPVPEESAVLPQAEEAEVTETEITQPLTEAISPPPPTTEAAASPPLPTISEPGEENYNNKEESTVSPVPTVQEITEGVSAVVPEVSEVPKTVEEVVPEVPTEPKEVPNLDPEVPAVVPKVEDEVVETSNIQSDL